ncbi:MULTISPECIES: YjfI family protein [Pseudomonas]|uniref:YjfI family protein n=1 Tax=Pseudomonas quercus TaxID=2722792 RepID=A0ABX0YI88_9PSED|nr:MULTISPECIES: YjfI family protein [Pseudomonas]MBF7143399.1 YjfI family protein [Pseudomonas sp. LY10J]NJP01703.1 YjfI family protein [Pseudomonas quercus]
MPPRKKPSAGQPATSSAPKTSADYVRSMRQRLAQAGLVKREFWILPENVDALRGIEKALRQPYLGERIKLENFMTQTGNWTIDTLRKALAEWELVTSGRVGLSDGGSQSILLTMTEHGDLPIYIAVSGDQVLVDTTLVEVAKVKDVAAFNALVLRSRDLFPLSSVGIETLGTGTEVYCMFGALSAASDLTVIVQEVLTLADNVIRASDAFEDHFNA